ncbi:MAG: hypothetical protein MMC33_002490 [Icmadophila ericetorum]|nr:hypothetical protein [Icmadophila ericetorum]
MRAYYRYGNSGKIVAVNIKDRPSETGLRCPICTEPVHGVRRYAIVDKIMALPHTLETMYAKLGRKLDMFEHQVSLKEKELDMTFNISCKTISTDTGPTTNPRDTDLVLSRSKFLKETQQDILRMRDEVAVPFEKTIFNLRKLFENPGRIPIVALPFKLRYESLWYRGRLIAFDESLRMIGHLQTMDQSIQHIPVLMEGLRMRAMEHTLTCIEKLKALILESESMSLKRLEVEFRLLQFAIFLVAKDLDQTPNLDIKATIARTAHLCKAFPDTAGKFLPCLHQLTNVYLRLAKSVPGRIKDWNCPPLKILWQCWGKYNPGHLQYCQYGHPFSRQSFPYCPECGRELKVVDKNAKPHASAYASVRATQAKRDIRVRLPSAWSTAPPPTATASAKTSSTMAPSATALAGPSATSEATKNS